MQRLVVMALSLAPLTAFAAPKYEAVPAAVRSQIRADAKSAGFLKPGSSQSLRTWAVSNATAKSPGMVSGNIWSPTRFVVGKGNVTGARTLISTGGFVTAQTAKGVVATRDLTWTPREYTK